MVSARMTYIFLAITVAALWCIAPLGVSAFHYSVDQVMHLRIAEGKTIYDVAKLALYEVHPPLGYLFWHFWLQWFNDPASVKAMGLLFTTASILMGYKIGALLEGRLAGLCIALLLATSHGMLVQSYHVRNYAVLMFFLLGQMYYYLKWTRRREVASLASYGLFSVLAVNIHLLAIFNTFVFASVYTVRWLLRRGRMDGQVAAFIMSNLAVGAVGIFLYSLWASTIHFFSDTVALTHPSFFDDLGQRLLMSALYLLPTLMYFSPGEYVGILFFLSLPWIYLRRRAGVSELLPYSYAALVIAVAAYLTRTSPSMATRHELWLVPFIIPVLGISLAHCIQWCAALCSRKNVVCKETYIFGGVLALCTLLCAVDPDRFNDQGEHEYSEKVWHEVTEYLASLPPTTLVVMGRQDAILFLPGEDDIYEEFAKISPGKQPRDIAFVKPLFNTRLLFSSYYMFIRKKERLLWVKQQLTDNPELQSVQKLVFVKTLSDINNEPAFFCNGLDKKVFEWPRDGMKDDSSTRKLSVVEMDKNVFLNDLMDASGKAHRCMPTE